jgi:hypothetical protein
MCAPVIQSTLASTKYGFAYNKEYSGTRLKKAGRLHALLFEDTA